MKKDKEWMLNKYPLEQKNKPDAIGGKEKQLGLELLKDPNFFDRIWADMETLGYESDENAVKLIYLAASSRKQDNPISVIALIEPAAGIETLIHTVKKLIPPEDQICLPILSEQALNYLLDKDLRHKFLIMGEMSWEIFEQQVRRMIETHKQDRLAVFKDEKTEGPVRRKNKKKLIFSAAMLIIDEFIKKRNTKGFFVVKSREIIKYFKQTNKPEQKRLNPDCCKQKSAAVSQIIKQHWSAQRLLKKVSVVNPFATLINSPGDIIKTRQDYEKLMALISTVCFLRQYQKELKQIDSMSYIECDLKDYEIAYEIMTKTDPLVLDRNY